jgi:hypothetical protein
MPHKHDFPHSSSIQGCEYHPDKNELHITFASGGRHCFHDVDQETFEGFKAAESPGSFFHLNIKKSFKNSRLD